MRLWRPTYECPSPDFDPQNKNVCKSLNLVFIWLCEHYWTATLSRNISLFPSFHCYLYSLYMLHMQCILCSRPLKQSKLKWISASKQTHYYALYFIYIAWRLIYCIGQIYLYEDLLYIMAESRKSSKKVMESRKSPTKIGGKPEKANQAVERGKKSCRKPEKAKKAAEKRKALL